MEVGSWKFIKRDEKRDVFSIYPLYHRSAHLSSISLLLFFFLFSLFFILNWTHIAQGRMHSYSIIVHFNVGENCYFCLFSTRKVLFFYTLFFECCPKAFNHCVIVTITFFAHTSLDAMLGKHHLIAGARIFASTIRMMDQASSRLSLEQCHRKCRFCKFCIMVITH